MRWLLIIISCLLLSGAGLMCASEDTCGFPCENDADCPLRTCVNGRCSGVCEYTITEKASAEPNEATSEPPQESTTEPTTEPKSEPKSEPTPEPTQEPPPQDAGVEPLPERPAESLPDGRCNPGSAQSCYPPGQPGCKPGGDCPGICKLGKQTCQADGSWGACTGFVTPEKEKCDGKDSDCDGQPSNLLPVACDTTKPGECAAGATSCQEKNGTWEIVCTEIYQPKAEVCDGKDNDCNGLIDDGLINCVTTHAGSGSPGLIDGNAEQAGFQRPQGIAVDDKGIIYVADTLHYAIRKVDQQGNTTTIAGGNQGTVDGVGRAAQFVEPLHLVFSLNGTNRYLYIVDRNGTSSKVRRLDLTTQQVSSLTGTLKNPTGIAINSKGEIFVSEAGRHVIRQYQPGNATTPWKLVAGLLDNPGAKEGDEAVATFNNPAGLAFDDNDNLYVADSGNHKIRKVEFGANGKVTVSTVAGSGQSGSVDGLRTSASFAEPFALTFLLVKSVPYLYVSEISGATIREIELSGANVTTRAGNGTRGSTDGAGPSARFDRPAALAVYQGVLYIADEANHLLRKLDLSTNDVSTHAGQNPRVAVDGTGAAAILHSPSGVFFDIATKDLYIAERGAQRIRKLTEDANGLVTVKTILTIPSATLPVGSAWTAGLPYEPEPHKLTLGGGKIYFTNARAPESTRISVMDVAGGGLGILSDSAGQPFVFQEATDLVYLDGKLYVVDAVAHCIYLINLANYGMSVLAGQAGISGNVDDPDPTKARFDRPHSIVAVSSTTIKKLYVVDQGNKSLRQIDLNNNATVATSLTDAAFEKATFLAHQPQGNGFFYFGNWETLYQLEFGSKKISTLFTIAKPLYRDGALASNPPALQAGFTGFDDVTAFWNPMLKTLVLYVADRDAHRIRRVRLQ